METISMGLDAGFGGIKIWSDDGGLEILSQVAVNGNGHLDAMVGLKSDKRPLMVTTNDGDFYIGAKAHNYGRPIENLDFNRLTGSPEMRALVYGTWSRYMQEHSAFDAPLSLMVGLPLQTMGENMKDYRKAMKSWLVGTHSWRADGIDYGVVVERVRLNSQPVGAFFDFVMDDNGKTIPEHRSVLTDEVGVLSVGFNTLEFMVVENQTATENLTGGEKLGVRRLLDLLNPNHSYSLGQLDLKLRNGDLKHNDKLPIWISEVNGAIEDIWDKALDRFAAVLVVGGGAVLLGDKLKLRGKGVPVIDPVKSISHGLFKINKAKQ
jgi:hypothetical protein